jgi:hypothetical protein
LKHAFHQHPGATEKFVEQQSPSGIKNPDLEKPRYFRVATMSWLDLELAKTRQTSNLPSRDRQACQVKPAKIHLHLQAESQTVHNPPSVSPQKTNCKTGATRIAEFRLEPDALRSFFSQCQASEGLRQHKLSDNKPKFLPQPGLRYPATISVPSIL